MKGEIRLLGIDDCPFTRGDYSTRIVGVLYRGGRFPDGVLSTSVDVDGTDATDTISHMVRGSKFYDQIRAVLVKGIAVAGFNIIDARKLSKDIKRPVIIVMRTMPQSEEMKAALSRLGFKKQLLALHGAGKIHKSGKLLFQCHGCSPHDAREIITLSTTHGNLPEPLRVAHLIAGGITLGESRGKA